MAWIEARMVRKFRFEMPDDIAEYLMLEHENIQALGENEACDAAWNTAISAFNRWNASEDANTPFCFDENASCVLGSEILPGFEIVPESALNDGTTIV